MKSGYEKVLNHLLFHKALEEDSPEKIDRYLALLERVQEGFDYSGGDRYERGVAAAFQLVVEQSFDPWDIDLARFSQVYLKRLKHLGTVNFTTAGRLILLAWSVLNLQTQSVLFSAEPVNPPAEELYDSWDITPGLYRDPEDVEFAHQLLVEEETPLHEAFQRDVRRPVTLLDFLDAFSQAFEEAAVAAKMPSPLKKPRSDAIRGKIHGEDLEEDIQHSWSLILALGKEVVGLSELCNGNRWDRATLFLSILFLSDMGWLEIWQDDFPRGEVYLRPLRESKIVGVLTQPREAQVA
ncbi:MAG: hypothetical protein V3U52_07300 [Thermoplasmata archaeon]